MEASVNYPHLQLPTPMTPEGPANESYYVTPTQPSEMLFDKPQTVELDSASQPQFRGVQACCEDHSRSPDYFTDWVHGLRGPKEADERRYQADLLPGSMTGSAIDQTLPANFQLQVKDRVGTPDMKSSIEEGTNVTVLRWLDEISAAQGLLYLAEHPGALCVNPAKQPEMYHAPPSTLITDSVDAVEPLASDVDMPSSCGQALDRKSQTIDPRLLSKSWSEDALPPSVYLSTRYQSPVCGQQLEGASEPGSGPPVSAGQELTMYTTPYYPLLHYGGQPHMVYCQPFVPSADQEACLLLPARPVMA